MPARTIVASRCFADMAVISLTMRLWRARNSLRVRGGAKNPFFVSIGISDDILRHK